MSILKSPFEFVRNWKGRFSFLKGQQSINKTYFHRHSETVPSSTDKSTHFMVKCGLTSSFRLE